MQRVLQPVDVIAVHSSDGRIIPICFCAENEHRERFRVDVVEVIRVTQIEYVGAEAAVYQCRIKLGDRCITAEFKYKFRNHRWYLLK